MTWTINGISRLCSVNHVEVSTLREKSAKRPLEAFLAITATKDLRKMY